MSEQLVLTGWLKENFIEKSYVLREAESLGDIAGDSLHHTMCLFAFMKLHKRLIPNEPNVLMDDFCGDQMLEVLFLKEAVKFVDRGRLRRSWISRDPEKIEWAKINFTSNWWLSTSNVSRDQTHAFLIACGIFGQFSGLCSDLVHRSFPFFPNWLKNRTLIQKRWYLGEFADLCTIDTVYLGYFAGRIGWLRMFQPFWDLGLILNALLSARSASRTDHIKLILVLIQRSLLDRSWAATIASHIFVKYRRNNLDAEQYSLGHPVLNVVRRYFRPDAGHADAVYWLISPVIQRWIKISS